MKLGMIRIVSRIQVALSFRRPVLHNECHVNSCHLPLFVQDSDSFLESYKNVLAKKQMEVRDDEILRKKFEIRDREQELTEVQEMIRNDDYLRKILTAVVTLLRRRSNENRLCCDDDRYLEVVDVDIEGFVTLVKCRSCGTETETICRGVDWTMEKIDRLQQLKEGDHICWHRPYAIWHHAIVVKVHEQVGETKIIHYSGSMTVEETDISAANQSCRCCCSRLWGKCDTLYRVNYQLCYNNEYTVLRARKLKNEQESRYNLIARNCEHFSRWCKTGSTTSSQISIAMTSLGKLILWVGLKAFCLLIVGLLQFWHESQEEKVRDRSWLEKMQNIVLSVYIVVMSIVFVIYLLKSSGSRLGRVTGRRGDAMHKPFLRLFCCYRPNTKTCIGTPFFGFVQCLCCIWSSGCSLLFRLFCDVFKHIQCSPFKCYGRHGHLACGLFTRIVIREICAAAGTLSIVLNEEAITNQPIILQLAPISRTIIIVGLASAAHIICYIIGLFIGRWAEAVWYILYESCGRTHTRVENCENLNYDHII